MLNIAITAPWTLIPVLVTLIVSPSANAAFYVAWMLVSFLYMVPASLSTVLFAVVAADPKVIARKLRFTLGISLLIGLPGMAVLIIGWSSGPEPVRCGLSARGDVATLPAGRQLSACYPEDPLHCSVPGSGSDSTSSCRPDGGSNLRSGGCSGRRCIWRSKGPLPRTPRRLSDRRAGNRSAGAAGGHGTRPPQTARLTSAATRDAASSALQRRWCSRPAGGGDRGAYVAGTANGLDDARFSPLAR